MNRQPESADTDEREDSNGRPVDPVGENIETISRLDNVELERRTRADVIADRIAGFTGTISFIVVHLAWFGLWFSANTGLLPLIRPFDSYPFPLLGMIVSMESVLLVTFVLIKQNRMAYLSDRRAHLDLQVNLLAEHEITHVLRLLQKIARRLQVEDAYRGNELTEETEVEGLVHALDQKLSRDC